MKKLATLLLVLALVAPPEVSAYKIFGGGYKEQVGASDIDVETEDFNGNLSSSDKTVQKALDTIDDMTAGLTDAPSDNSLYARKNAAWESFDLSGYVTGTPWQSEGYLTDAPSDGSQYLRLNGAWSTVTIPAGTINRVATFTFDGNYAAPAVGSTASCVMGYDGSFTGWKIINEAGTSSSIVLTIKKNGSAVSGTEKPTLSSASSATDTSLTTWTVAFSKGDVIQAYVDSASTGVKYVCSLYAEATT